MNHADKPIFWIVTPSFNHLAWMKFCIASVADQAGDGTIVVHHHIQDACSTDGTAPWLAAYADHLRANPVPNYTFSFATEKDEGMYDAINRGWRRAPQNVDIVAHLNADEQYLEGALSRVAKTLIAQPKNDIWVADIVVIDKRGAYCCSRQVLVPFYWHTYLWVVGTFTAATFFRRSLLDRQQAYFDAGWKTIGDAVWVLDRLQQGARFKVIRQYVAAFADTGKNLALSPIATTERERLAAASPKWARAMKRVWLDHHRLRRLAHGLYRPRPFSYAIYRPENTDQRQSFQVQTPTPYWLTRLRRDRNTQCVY